MTSAYVRFATSRGLEPGGWHVQGTNRHGSRVFRGESKEETTLARSCSTTELFPRHSATWYHGSVRVSPQGLGRVLGRHRVDEEPAAPLESRHARELRDDLEVPVERLELTAAQGRRVEHEVERGVLEHAVHPAQEVAQEPGESVQLVHAGLVEPGPMDRRKDPRLEGEARCERRERDEAASLDNRPR